MFINRLLCITSNTRVPQFSGTHWFWKLYWHACEFEKKNQHKVIDKYRGTLERANGTINLLIRSVNCLPLEKKERARQNDWTTLGQMWREKLGLTSLCQLQILSCDRARISVQVMFVLTNKWPKIECGGRPIVPVLDADWSSHAKTHNVVRRLVWSSSSLAYIYILMTLEWVNGIINEIMF